MRPADHQVQSGRDDEPQAVRVRQPGRPLRGLHGVALLGQGVNRQASGS